DLERGGEVEDRLAVLDRDHAAHRKAATVARALDVVDDRLLDVARTQEVGVRRMRAACAVDRLLRGREGLAEHLAAEYVARADVAALAAEQVVLEAFEGQQFDEFVDYGFGHGDWPEAGSGEWGSSERKSSERL